MNLKLCRTVFAVVLMNLAQCRLPAFRGDDNRPSSMRHLELLCLSQKVVNTY